MAQTMLIDWCNNQGEFGKKLLSEWTGINERGENVDINKIAKGSHIKMIWRCTDCNHEWCVDVHNRTGYKTSCPKCAHLQESERSRRATTQTSINDLKTWCSQHGEYGEYLLLEWTGNSIDNKHYDVDKIARGSSKILIWRCSTCGNEWNAPPIRRTGKHKGGCPHCNTRSTSYPEQFLFFALKSCFPDAISRGKYLGYEYDITPVSKF